MRIKAERTAAARLAVLRGVFVCIISLKPDGLGEFLSADEKENARQEHQESWV
jgi:hypothetical protein